MLTKFESLLEKLDKNRLKDVVVQSLLRNQQTTDCTSNNSETTQSLPSGNIGSAASAGEFAAKLFRDMLIDKEK